MLKPLIILSIIAVSNGSYVTKMASELTVYDSDLPKNEKLNVKGIKKTDKERIEHIIIKNCSGVIDSETLQNFPKLKKLTIWKSNIQELSTTLPITHLIVIGSHFPNLNLDFTQNIQKLQNLVLLGNKNFFVDPLVLKNFKNLAGLYISEANFTSDCVTKEWFKEMTSLSELGLSDNALSCFSYDAFNSLTSLRKLDLTYNKISNLERKLFKKLRKLESLGLYENSFRVLDVSILDRQGNHLEMLGVSWDVVRDSGISVDNLVKTLPNLKSMSFGHKEEQSDAEIVEFCQKLRENGVSCLVDSVFGTSNILGYGIHNSNYC